MAKFKPQDRSVSSAKLKPQELAFFSPLNPPLSGSLVRLSETIILPAPLVLILTGFSLSLPRVLSQTLSFSHTLILPPSHSFTLLSLVVSLIETEVWSRVRGESWCRVRWES